MYTKKVLESILNKKEENLFSIGTVVTIDPLTVKFPPDTTAVPAIITEGMGYITAGSRIIILRYNKQYIALGTIGINKSLIQCVLKNTGTYTISTASTSTLNFGSGTTVYDPIAMHSETTNTSRIVIPKDGVYTINCCGRFTNSTASGGRILYVMINGSTINSVCSAPDTGGRWGGSNVLTTYLETDDYVQFGVYQSTGSDLNFGGSGFNTTHFSVAMI